MCGILSGHLIPSLYTRKIQNFLVFYTYLCLEIPAHIIPYSKIVKKTLNAAYCADSNVSVPKLLIGPVHHVLLCNCID